MEPHFYGRQIKKDGRLVPVKPADKVKYEKFVASIPEGTQVDFFSEMLIDDGTLTQLAAVHAKIRRIAIHTGATFRETKDTVKERAGLCLTGRNKNGNEMTICKSFADCSIEELSLAIQAVIEIGQILGCPVD